MTISSMGPWEEKILKIGFKLSFRGRKLTKIVLKAEVEGGLGGGLLLATVVHCPDFLSLGFLSLSLSITIRSLVKLDNLKVYI